MTILEADYREALLDQSDFWTNLELETRQEPEFPTTIPDQTMQCYDEDLPF
jgi:hypothetical protein